MRPRSRIAVLYIVGTIASGKGGFDPVNGSIAGSEAIVEQIRKIRDDNSIKAIVLRIDSPGGSSVASDVIWRELTITRQDNPSRPIVTSMSDLAASGGYYIAIPADAIVAQPGTLTGSIGIFGGKIVIGGTLGKAGIGTETVTSGANADMYSPFTPFTAPQRAKVEEFMQDFYKGFVGKVAESRKTTPEAIHAVAQGRVWTGRQALAHGLVDSAWRTRYGRGSGEGTGEDSGRRGRSTRRVSRASQLLRCALGAVRRDRQCRLVEHAGGHERTSRRRGAVGTDAALPAWRTVGTHAVHICEVAMRTGLCIALCAWAAVASSVLAQQPRGAGLYERGPVSAASRLSLVGVRDERARDDVRSGEAR